MRRQVSELRETGSLTPVGTLSGRLPRAGLVRLLPAAASAALGLSLFLQWYSVRRPASLGPGVVDGWSAFAHIDLVIVVVAVVALLGEFFVPRAASRVVQVGCGVV